MIDSTVSFTYKLPDDAPGGEYLVMLSQYGTPTVKKLFRVRDYDRDQLIVSASLSIDAYFPGDTVNGKLKVYPADGSAF